MSKTIRLDQVFYGSGPAGYGILATSLAETSIAQSAINACLAVGQIPGSGLAKPVFLSRAIGDWIVMARLCNGARDSSGRNTLFIHALVGSAQEVRAAHVSTFSLEEAGAFCDKTSDASSRPVMANAQEGLPPADKLSQVPLDIPAAIEASEPDAALMRRIVSGKENVLSWSTFAYDDMPGYDVICLSTLASTPAGRSIYNTELNLVRGVTANRNAPAPVSPPRVEKPSCPPQRNPMPTEGVQKRRNGLLISLLVSIAVNIVLLVAFMSRKNETTTRGTGGDNNWPTAIVEAARQKFTGENCVTDEDFKNCDPPLGNLFRKDGKVSKDRPEQIELFHKLLAYKHFVEECVLNQTNKSKEK